MSPRLFGTDGVRAPFGEPPLDTGTVFRLGQETARFLAESQAAPTIVLGGDTRSSTPEICSWLASGILSAGGRVTYGGTLPTPAIARITSARDAAAGIAVSASHNPWPDNGIKLLASNGQKWPDADEDRIGNAVLANRERPELVPIAEFEVDSSIGEEYLETLVGFWPPDSLQGLDVVLDTGNGAAYALAPRLFQSLGANVHVLFDQPDGSNINRECGSTHPEALQSAVVERGADLGFAFDGDADRALAVDETGTLRDGDALLFLWASRLLDSGELQPSKIVATSMSNLGLERALGEQGIGVVRCDVGDRFVVQTLLDEGLRLGGEQSGHVVDLHRSTTGDGLITAAQIAYLAHHGPGALSQQLVNFRRYPQVLLNTRVQSKPDLATLSTVVAAERAAQDELGSDGRIVLRYSGTEPLARVMIEGPDTETIERLASTIVEAIDEEVGAP